MRGGEGVGCLRVGDQARFGRLAGKAAEAAILEGDEADAVGGELAEARGAVAQRAAIAVEIEDDRFVFAAARRARPGFARRRRR